MHDFKAGDFVYGCHNKAAHTSSARNFYMAVVLESHRTSHVSVLTLYHRHRHIHEIKPTDSLYSQLMEFFSHPNAILGELIYARMPDGTAQIMNIEVNNLSKALTLEQALKHMEELSGNERPQNLNLLYNYRTPSSFQQAMPPSSL